MQIHTIGGEDLARVHVPPSSFPVEATVTVEKGGQFHKKSAFYVRIGNSTREITDPTERQRYIATIWSTTGLDARRAGTEERGPEPPREVRP